MQLLDLKVRLPRNKDILSTWVVNKSRCRIGSQSRSEDGLSAGRYTFVFSCLKKWIEIDSIYFDFSSSFAEINHCAECTRAGRVSQIRPRYALVVLRWNVQDMLTHGKLFYHVTTDQEALVHYYHPLFVVFRDLNGVKKPVAANRQPFRNHRY